MSSSKAEGAQLLKEDDVKIDVPAAPQPDQHQQNNGEEIDLDIEMEPEAREDDPRKIFKCTLRDIKIERISKKCDPYILFKIGGEEPPKKNRPDSKKKTQIKVPPAKAKENPKAKLLALASQMPGMPTQEEMMRKKSVRARTDTVSSVKKGNSCSFKKTFVKYWKGTYEQLEKEDVRVEIWNRYWLRKNRKMGEAKINLGKLANGCVQQSVEVAFRKPGKVQEVIGKVTFLCYFQEVFDFEISFEEWKSPKLVFPPEMDHPKMMLEFSVPGDFKKIFRSGGYFGRSSTSSVLDEATNTPVWESGGTLVYHGTRSELENDDLTINLYHSPAPGVRIPIATAEVPLRGVIDYGYLEGPLIRMDARTSRNITLGSIEGYASFKDVPGHCQFGESIPLKEGRQYLGVHIKQISDLICADTDGYSDAFVSVSWDGMKQETKVIENELNPYYDEYLWFPVRVANVDAQDLAAKPDIQINVYDYDEDGNDFLGGCKIPLSAISKGAKSTAKADLEQTRIHIDNILLVKPGMPDIRTRLSVGVFFTPDLPADVVIPERPRELEQEEEAQLKELPAAYTKREAEWRQHLEAAKKIGVFPVKAQDEKLHFHFLSSYLLPTRPPKDLYNPLRIARLIQCMTWAKDSDTYAGLNDVWSSPGFFAEIKKGDSEDHAILMCNLFLGLEKDAYLCVGRTTKGEEHVWVLTREADGSVLMWETTLGRAIPMPGRWVGKPVVESPEEARKRKKAQKKLKEEDYLFFDDDEVISEERILSDNFLGARSLAEPEPTNENAAKKTKQEKDDDSELSPVSLPYASIEVIFNHENLWANLQNSDPARIMYNFEDETRWLPFIGPKDSALDPFPFYRTPRLSPKLPPSRVLATRELIVKEVKAGFLIWRQKENLPETRFADAMRPVLEEGLAIMERLKVTGPEEIEKASLVLKEAGAALSAAISVPHSDKPEKDKERSADIAAARNKLKEAQEDFRKYDLEYWRASLVSKCPKGYMFEGVPVSFSYVDKIRIRKFLMEKYDLQKETNPKVRFAVAAVVTPYHNTVSSVWVYVAKLVPKQ